MIFNYLFKKIYLNLAYWVGQWDARVDFEEQKSRPESLPRGCSFLFNLNFNDLVFPMIISCSFFFFQNMRVDDRAPWPMEIIKITQ